MILITVSRMMGAGAEVISERVAKELGEELYNDGRMVQAAREMGLKTEELAGLDERQPGFFERLWGQRPMVMLDILQSVVYEIARRGGAVIVGHGGQVMLKEFDCALHVHIHAPFKKRVERIMKLNNMDRSTAEHIVRNSDRQRGGFLRYAFHIDWEDPQLYDMVVNTEKVGIDTAVQMILDVARSDEIKACSATAMDTMARMALASRAEARLLETGLSSFSLSVRSPQKGVVDVSGLVNDIEEKEIIDRVLRELPEVKEVNLNVVVRPLEAE
ncbi:MAG: cytidylate kinase-like family protein [Deltaproteobacteria bacterium]|nr:cytidylate kinase-like family protein [Deltaproteobacteria bacterium]